MRLFLAINFPAPLREAVHLAAAPLREAAPDAVTWVAHDRLHLTVKFVGDQSEDAVERLREAVTLAAERHREIPIGLAGFGAFPTFRRARVIWLGVTPEPRLELLHHDVEERCAALGFELEGRAFRPHVTLGRLRERAPEEVGRTLARAARSVQFHQMAVVSSVDVMQSTLSSSGPRYELLASVPLGGR